MKIDIGLQKIDKIFHLADIHIRSLKRHTEYRQVFDRTYESIKSQLTPNSVIYLAGDIVHNKLDLSPECVDLTQDFFRKCADIAPTLIIAGNHDCNLNNTSRQDALEPIIKALNHKNIHYLKDSGIYGIAGIDWVVMSVWDDPTNFITADKCTQDYKIALHHGAVHKSQNDIGYVITNDHVTIERFDGYDLTLLGDIHKHQYLNKENTIHYPGSLIQQNHGERLSHGYTVWNVETKESKYIEIENDYGYVTLLVNEGKLKNIVDIPKKPRIRLKIENTKASDIKKILATVKQKYKVQDVSLQRINTIQGDDDTAKISLGDIRDTEYQNTLITKYVENKYPDVTDKLLDHVRHINRTTNSKLPTNEAAKNITWLPKKFTFSNMFSYGEDNLVDFTNMKGTYGLFAPNASGKSAMLDALTYCIFDKCSRSTKGAHVINNKRQSYVADFNFEIQGIDYYIHRTGTRQKSGNVKVLVDFYRIIDGHKESLNGEQRDETNKEIRKYLGQYDDFVLTALSLQNNNTGFIDMTQRHRKDLLSKFLDIGIFEDLYQIASKEISEVSVLLKKLKREDFSTKLATNQTEISKYEVLIADLQAQQLEVKDKLDKHNEQLSVLLQGFETVNTTVTDISLLNNDKISYVNSISKYEKSLLDINDELQLTKDTRKQLINTKPTNVDEITKNWERCILLDKSLTDVNNNIDKLDLEIKHKESKLDKLEEHEYDPNCEFCINNVFVKDAVETEKDLIEDNKELTKLHQTQESIISDINTLGNAVSKYEGLLELNTLIEKATTKMEGLASNHKYVKAKLESTQKDLLRNAREQQEYTENETAIKHNKKQQIKVDELKDIIRGYNTQNQTYNDDILKCNGTYQVSLKSKNDIIDKINELSELETQYEAYEKYLKSIQRDGVPYDLMSTALPKIEQEVNNILTQLTDFTIVFNTDGKNINAYIVYDDENFWLLELTSGMEKFIASLAIRNALISVSNLPRPNFIAIDEGLGNLDSTMLNQMFLMLDYLKSQYDFLIMISHIDATRDMVDTQIEISKPNGFSKISHS